MRILTLLTDIIPWILQWYMNRINHEAHRDPAADPVFGPGWRRMHRLIRRLIKLAAKWQAGTLPTPRLRGPRARTDRAPPRDKLPRTNCRWMCNQFPQTVPALGGAILNLCENPQVMALFAAAPQAGRILRPLCQMIGLKPPPYLQLPPRPRRPRRKAAPKPRQPREINVKRLSSVAYGKLVHPDHPGHPPARIGYARPRHHKRDPHKRE